MVNSFMSILCQNCKLILEKSCLLMPIMNSLMILNPHLVMQKTKIVLTAITTS